MATVEQRNLYDEVPYPDLVFAQTHPALLSMLGQLLGMSPAPAEKCRVLEIGTAGGGNILPMAAVLPNSTFVGFDYSIVQIERAKAVVRETGLTNITFHHMNIMDVTPEFGQFDYIIAHGIYSWVPPEVQDKVLDICKRNLAPQGIAYISYNTYPGWHMLDIVRNQMLYRTRNIPNNSEKAQKGQEWIEFMAHVLTNHTDATYTSAFETYLGFRSLQLSNLEESAVLHEELETYNQPLYFHQFVERAEGHDLQYLVESEFPTVMPTGLTKEVTDYLSKIVQTPIELEQYYDFLHNRTFRRTLLCHADVKVERRINSALVPKFYISSNSVPNTTDAEKERGIESFTGTDGSKFSTDHPLTKAAFHCLVEALPLRLTFGDLIRRAQSRLTGVKLTDDDATLLAGNLLKAFSYSDKLMQFHSFAPQMTTTVSERPLATELARFQALRGTVVVNLLHLQTDINNFTRLVLTNLDGDNTYDELLDFLVKLAQAGEINLPSTDQIPKTPEEIRQSLAGQLDATLQRLASLGMLVA
ncbi:MAG: methyltransferase domain-containing protein [Anaerolineaceae bacterium]|nr:methyltransferase domain-containing protein [Anaerolineaceae bacterium]